MNQQTSPGTRVCTVGRDGSRKAGPYNQLFTGKIYEAVPRKDGTLTWRLCGKYGGTRSGKAHSSAKFVNEVKAVAPHEWKDVTQNQVCD